MWGNFSPIRVAGAESPPREEQNPITPHPSCLCHASGGVVEAEGGGGAVPLVEGGGHVKWSTGIHRAYFTGTGKQSAG